MTNPFDLTNPYDRYDLALFDLDGTLTDSRLGITRGIQHALRRAGRAVPPDDAIVPLIGPPLLESFRSLGCDDTEAHQLVSDYRDYFATIGIFENTVYPGIAPLLERLAGERTLALATSKPTVYAERILAHFDLRRWFRAVVGSELDGRRTAKAEVVRDALAAVPGARQPLMIGDREHDILGARANNVPTVAVGYGYGSLAELRAAAPLTIAPTVADLAAFFSDH